FRYLARSAATPSAFFLTPPRSSPLPSPPPFPYTMLFRSSAPCRYLMVVSPAGARSGPPARPHAGGIDGEARPHPHHHRPGSGPRSEEHTSELQSRFDLVCRLLLQKKKEGD